MSFPRSCGVFLIVAAFLCYEMAVQVSPGVITRELMEDLRVSAIGLSWISGAYFITYTLMQIPAGLIYDRVHVRDAVIFPILLCAAGSYALSLASDMPAALFARMLMGFGSAFAFIAVLVVISDLFPERYFAFMAGVTQLIAALGALLGEVPIVRGVALFGWRKTMAVIALGGILLAVIVFVFVRYRKHHSSSALEPGQIFRSLRQICNNKQTWFLGIYACLLWAPMATFASLWGVPFIKKIVNIPQDQAASLVSMMWIGIAIGSPLLGWFSDKIALRKIPLILIALLGTLSMALVIFAADLVDLIVLRGCLFLSGFACAGQVLSFAVVKENNRYRNHAAAIGFNNMGVVLAGFLFQPLAGKFIENHRSISLLRDNFDHYTAYDYQAGLILMPLCYLLGCLIALFFIRETHCQRMDTLEKKGSDQSSDQIIV